MVPGTWQELWQAAARRFGPAWDGPLELLFPRICAMCEQPLVDSQTLALCRDCLGRFEPFAGNTCSRCANPLAASADSCGTCRLCRSRNYAFESAVALGPYRGALREAVLLAKRASHEVLAAALGELLVDVCRQRWAEPFDLVVPLPMHWRRRFARGANGVERTAEALARGLNCPCRLDLLAYARPTAKQGLLAPQDRFANVRGALRAKRFWRLGRRLRQKTVLLVDDVMTTGATASEAARALRRAGAACVRVAVVARGTG